MCPVIQGKQIAINQLSIFSSAWKNFGLVGKVQMLFHLNMERFKCFLPVIWEGTLKQCFEPKTVIQFISNKRKVSKMLSTSMKIRGIALFP